jgi:hypothetical protein
MGYCCYPTLFGCSIRMKICLFYYVEPRVVMLYNLDSYYQNSVLYLVFGIMSMSMMIVSYVNTTINILGPCKVALLPAMDLSNFMFSMFLQYLVFLMKSSALSPFSWRSFSNWWSVTTTWLSLLLSVVCYPKFYMLGIWFVPRLSVSQFNG